VPAVLFETVSEKNKNLKIELEKTQMKKLITICAVATMMLVISSVAQADLFWGDGSPNYNSGNTGPALFQLDTATGTVGKTYTYSSWNWIMDVEYAPGGILYVSHNTTAVTDNMKIAKVDAATGTVLSDTSIAGFLGQTKSQVNALEFVNGKLYGVENATSGSTIRGYALEIGLDGSGDPIFATKGAYVGGAPDGALAYKDGIWYASDWKSNTSSWIKTTTDIMNTNFTAGVGTSPVGLFAGWDFDKTGNLLGVNWNGDFKVYQINLTTGVAASLGYDIKSQLPSQITMLGGLTTPEPATICLLGLGALSLIRRKRGA
jgi:hypothetical protein